MTTRARGLFITIEGGEGGGKSTLARGLAAHIEACGHAVVCTREPGGSPGAEALRQLLLHGPQDRWSPLSEALLFTAARNDHLERTVRPALARGAVVICDRYLDSTHAYQTAGGLDPGASSQLAKLIAADLPDLTLILDVPPDQGLARAGRQADDRFEHRSAAFHARVRAAFLEIAQREPQRCRVLDAQAPAEQVLRAAQTAWRDLEARA